jgi:tetratricopeptide (TPR) repeat protein
MLFQTGLLSPIPDADRLTIIDGGKIHPYGKVTEFDSGPAVGEILNNHFFPGVIYYNLGNYNYSVAELTYVIRRPAYLDKNSRKAEFMSTTHYLRGMIYLYHAEGIGRHGIARSDFEAAIKWNPENHLAYLELSRVYSELGFTKQAIAIVQHLIELKPAKDILDEAEQELRKLTNPGPN